MRVWSKHLEDDEWNCNTDSVAELMLVNQHHQSHHALTNSSYSSFCSHDNRKQSLHNLERKKKLRHNVYTVFTLGRRGEFSDTHFADQVQKVIYRNFFKWTSQSSAAVHISSVISLLHHHTDCKSPKLVYSQILHNIWQSVKTYTHSHSSTARIPNLISLKLECVSSECLPKAGRSFQALSLQPS